jgi:endonuclease/exonuclease/phosphatase family metal-dependent hydrolase
MRMIAHRARWRHPLRGVSRRAAVGTRAGLGAVLATAIALSLTVAPANGAPSSAATSTRRDTLRVVTFNVLAPPWADPAYYPAEAAALLDRTYRRERIIRFLTAQARTTDIFALQETTPTELAHIAAAVPGFTPFQANHRPDYWSNWITPANPWEPNGVALLVKTRRFTSMSFRDVPLSSDGNHAAMMTAVSATTGVPVRVLSIHLDSDSAGNRNREFNAALSYLVARPSSIDFIAGDFNTDTDTGNLHIDIVRAGFTDILDSLGLATFTSPWSESYYAHGQWGVMDHVIVRGATPSSGVVYNFDQYLRYPDDQDARIVQNLIDCGSDHYPVAGSATR